MTSYERSGERPAGGKYLGFDHVHLWVSNSKQAATYYCLRFGFTEIAYKGLETGSRDVSSRVVRLNDVTLVFSSPLEPKHSEIGDLVNRQGDGVRDVAFAVDDARSLWKKAVERGAKSIMEPTELKDEHGVVTIATVQTVVEWNPLTTSHSFVAVR